MLENIGFVQFVVAKFRLGTPESDELVQEVFLRLHSSRSRIEKSKMRTQLATTARKMANDILRKQRAAKTSELDISSEAASDDELWLDEDEEFYKKMENAYNEAGSPTDEPNARKQVAAIKDKLQHSSRGKKSLILGSVFGIAAAALIMVRLQNFSVAPSDSQNVGEAATGFELHWIGPKGESRKSIKASELNQYRLGLETEKSLDVMLYAADATGELKGKPIVLLEPFQIKTVGMKDLDVDPELLSHLEKICAIATEKSEDLGKLASRIDTVWSTLESLQCATIVQESTP